MKSLAFIIATILVRVLTLCQRASGQQGGMQMQHMQQMRGRHGVPYQGHGNYIGGGYGPYPAMAGSYQGRQVNQGGYGPYNSMPYQGANMGGAYGSYNSMGGHPIGRPYSYRGSPYAGNNMAVNHMAGNPYVNNNDRTSVTSISNSVGTETVGPNVPAVPTNVVAPSPDFGIGNVASGVRTSAEDIVANIKQSVASDIAEALSKSGANVDAGVAGVGAEAGAIDAAVPAGIDESLKASINTDIAGSLQSAGAGNVAAQMG